MSTFAALIKKTNRFMIITKRLFFTTLLICVTISVFSQQEKQERWYVKLGGSYFMQMASTEFPSVNGLQPMKTVYKDNVLISEESVTGSFGEGCRVGGTVGYRFTPRLGLEMGFNYYQSKEKTMLQTVMNGTTVVQSDGQVTAFDIAPALVLYIGNVKGFEPYTKVGVIIPIHGTLDITTNGLVGPDGKPNPNGVDFHRKDQISPNPTCGFQAALGTSYKIYKNLSAYAELEYRNFSVGSKDKEVKEYTVNGNDMLSQLPTSELQTEYHTKLDKNSNNKNFNTVDTSKPMDDLRSYISVSGLGLTLGLRMSF